MKQKIYCTLCEEEACFVHRFREKNYYRCKSCQAYLMDPAMHLSPVFEKMRYDEHNNDVDDPGYRNFVRPLVDKVKSVCSTDSTGLDFGAGPGPVAARMLQAEGYKIELYDLYYWPDHNLLKRKYDFIILSEVMEHFRNPRQEFALLRSLLRPGGSLFCMTEILKDDTDFIKWHYKNDPTHTFFYHSVSLEWIRENLYFSRLAIEDRVIHFLL